MNIAALQSFAQQARTLLRAGVEKKMVYGNLAPAQGNVDEVIENAAYTWFSRLMALKILGSNGYEPSQPNWMNETQAPTVLIRYCREHPLLRAIFGAMDEYTALLLPDDLFAPNGFWYFLNETDAISEADYKEAELMGWLYQYYFADKKDEIFAGFKQRKKAEARDIPTATQIFTPNWIVKYLVQNTLGRTWLDAHPGSRLRSLWKYLAEQAGTNAVHPPPGWNRTVQALTFLDPAAGSGHMLVEAFDVLYAMYKEEGYPATEAVTLILQQNLFGLDLDPRAAQLAQFALVLKAAPYSRTVLTGATLPAVYAMPPHHAFQKQEVALFLGDHYAGYTEQLWKALQTMQQAGNLGSIMVLELCDAARAAIKERHRYWLQQTAGNAGTNVIQNIFTAYIPILLILTERFSCIAANPPYMGRGNMNAALKRYLEKQYPRSKSDLYTVFIDVCLNRVAAGGRVGLINPPSWMFNVSYAGLRERVVKETTIESFLNFGRGVFGADFGTVAYILKNSPPAKEHLSVFRSLFRFKSLVDSVQQKEAWFLDAAFNAVPVHQLNFLKIDSCPFAYWLPEKVFDFFVQYKKLEQVAHAKQGMATSDNDRFRRHWPEVSKHRIGFAGYDAGRKWFPYNSGGAFRKWYGNQFYVVNWENEGYEITNFDKSVVRSPQFYFKESVSWSKVTIGGVAFRYFPPGFIFDVAGCSVFTNDHQVLKYLLGLLNSVLREPFIYALSQSVNYEVGIINKIPVIEYTNTHQQQQAVALVNACIALSKADWDSNEISWNFQGNPLIATKQPSVALSYAHWRQHVSKNFFQLHANEEALNRLYIDSYDLAQELSPSVPLKDISLLQEAIDGTALEQMEPPYEGKLVPVRANVVMQQLIGYIVGCYMGRYRLDAPGLHIAHPNPTGDEVAAYNYASSFGNGRVQIAEDAIIPVMGSNGNFSNDLLHRVQEFLSVVWGEANLTANVSFLQQQLGKKLEDYLVKDCWKYHVKVYDKKPIYWLFSSKTGAFKVLVYMHRMHACTVAAIRDNYLIPHIGWLQNRVADMEKHTTPTDKTGLKKLNRYRAQLTECRGYDLLLKPIADKQIVFDLDDGVRHNYALFKDVVADIQ
jgi:hypothetical protein